MRKVFLLALRDLRLEVRDRAGLLSVLAFFAVMLFIMALALGPDEGPLRQAAPGVLWVALAFGSTLLATRAFALEVEEGTLDDLLLTPGSKEWIYFGKLLFQMLLLLPLAALALLMAAGLFYLPLERGLYLFLTLALGVLGYTSVATFYAGLLARLRGREVLLPLLLFSLVVPVVLAAVRATTGLLEGLPLAEVAPWWQLLLVFDVVYLTASALLFPVILEG
ncbi:heme exporter protein CcmB [Thermus thermamylovorans]|uniref:Heme exporter protein B n=1 Tax=Thermus thermamylovorans TaxID=2509362 RepID=A0A4Q9AWS7_9DEIN|nr:heme exporter protein CcmB [Thermus thermamylovorans]TBH15351.1 cytochrome C biogenesis protein [Thermus thermamylovorans]